MKKRAFFIASTGQHVGKTTMSLGLVAGLHKHFGKVSYMKPIGQEHVEVTGIKVDKDVLLFKDRFNIEADYSSMSPVLFPRGFTRDYLDGKVDENKLARNIQSSFANICNTSDVAVIEGTGHVGVGSIINLNNAQVARLLNTDIILVASGGLGSSFDALSLNKQMCDDLGVNIAGIILNRVLPNKREMILDYMGKALKRWNIPILGCVPFDPFLSNPSFRDFESLFNTTLLTGQDHHLRHFKKIRLVAASVTSYLKLILPEQLIITPANREDIILATIEKNWEADHPLHTGMILTGDMHPTPSIMKSLKKADIPMFYTPLSSYNVMEKITSFTAKIKAEDHEKVQEAIDLVQANIDFPKLINATSM